ncbi:MAG TPA: MnhB domain-containing protein [Acidimicrobiales bacterium]|nr:MnhB domain-containing protein [Acidimicrobiales bacterium]
MSRRVPSQVGAHATEGKREPSLILETCVHTLFHTALLFSVFLLFAGHNAPGGGFVGGLVAGAAFVLRYVEGGSGEVQDAAPVPGTVLMGTGLTLAVATGAAALLGDGEFLSSGKLEMDVPLLGAVKATSALAFDIGVYLVVVGLVVVILTTLGAEPDHPIEAEEAP